MFADMKWRWGVALLILVLLIKAVSALEDFWKRICWLTRIHRSTK